MTTQCRPTPQCVAFSSVILLQGTDIGVKIGLTPICHQRLGNERGGLDVLANYI